MKTLILAILALSLTGCASLQYAGSADYELRPFLNSAGKSDCCEVVIHNGKEIASLTAHVTKTGDNYSVDLNEMGVAAFAGQKISAEALQAAVDDAVKASLVAAGVMVAPVAGAALGGLAATGGLGAAAIGAGAVVGTQKLAPAKP